MGRITYNTKSDRRTSDIPVENKVTAANMNEIKASVNALYDLMDQVYAPKAVSIVAGDFSGSNYTNTLLIGKTAGTDFNVFTNGGSGTLMSPSDGYSFNSGTGTITMDADNYLLIIFKKLT